jgi:hypothetical protein
MAATATPSSRRRLALPGFTVWLALAGLLALTAVVVLYLGRSTTFYFDEWNFVLERRAWDVDALLKPHNEHLSLVPVLVYKALFSTLGIDAYAPYRVAGVVVHLIVLVLLFVYARRRVGDVLALGVTVVLAVFGPAWPDILWPFQMGFLGSLAAGLGVLLCLDRGDRAGEIGASVLLVVALASSSMGIPIFIAVALEVLGRPDRRARWWILAAPAVLYGVWYLAYGGGGKESIDNLLATPSYVAEAAAAAVGSLFGLSLEWGRPLALAAGALLVWGLHRGASDPWRLWALIALPLVFWGLTGLARADLHEPGAPRYLYPGALFLILIAVEAARGVTLRQGGVVALLALMVFATVSNLGALRNGGGFLRDQAAALDGVLAATQLVGERVPPAFRPEPVQAPQISAGPYLAAVKDHGSPAPGPSELPQLFGRGRAAADATLQMAYGLTLAPASGEPSGQAPAPENAAAVEMTRRGSCLRASPQGTGSTLDVAVPAGGLQIDGAAKVYLRRFGDMFPQTALGGVSSGAPVTVKVPADGSTAPWHLRLAVSGPTRVCGL